MAQAAWCKYPNQINTVVIGTDVSCTRTASSKSYFLQWAQKLIGSLNVFYASGQSTEDPGKRLMTINLTFGSFLSVYETLSYVPHPTDPCKSLLKQEATVQVEGVPLNRYIPARNSMDELSATTQKIHKCVLLLAASRVGHFGNSPLRQFQERWMQASKKLLKYTSRFNEPEEFEAYNDYSAEEYQSWTTISTRSVGPGRGGKEDRNVRCEECDKPYDNRSRFSKLVNVQAHIKTAFGIKIALSAQRWKSTPR
ncbi:conserved hypothetical protein [Culex quinquefasciatus]|uniref:PRELI/MSF1 domain-containing protein n=1 Tax=Culex quinquefasciatus TaxID=7176 RepID=B0X728_CULQU|nr:conserved hypothetical protein [Culex quinquefasciatus]|eukprot:XP_001865450.1 conserved hypothetical protein [Culex quinquefasciatus]